MSEFGEPWRFERIKHPGYGHESRILSESGSVIASEGCYLGGEPPHDWIEPVHLSDEESQRIVACVNFCRNLPTYWLQKHVASSDQTSFGKFGADTRLWIQEIRE